MNEEDVTKEGSKKWGGNNRETGGAGGEVVKSQKPARLAVAINERGLVIGEDHPRAVLTDHEVDLLLELRDEPMSYGKLAVIFEVSKSCVAKICRGEHRSQIAVGYRRARVVGERR